MTNYNPQNDIPADWIPRSPWQACAERAMIGLRNGVVAWKRSFNVAEMHPFNPLSETTYRGSNIIFAWIRMTLEGWTDPRFATFDQIKMAGGSVFRKKDVGPGTAMIRWDKGFSKTRVDKDGNPEIYSFAKHFTVFNLRTQTDLTLPDLVSTYDHENAMPHADAEFLVTQSGANIQYKNGTQPCYIPSKDIIQMPERNGFETETEFELCRFHELVHWTGAESRLNRPLCTKDNLKAESYSIEELTAEMGAMFALSSVGIEQDEACFNNSTAYLQGWLNRLEEEPGIMVAAASKAAQAVNFLEDRASIQQAA